MNFPIRNLLPIKIGNFIFSLALSDNSIGYFFPKIQMSVSITKRFSELPKEFLIRFSLNSSVEISLLSY